MVEHSVTFCGFSIARDCIQQAQGIRTAGRRPYLDQARAGRQLRGDPGLAFVLNELERRADAGDLATGAALAAAAVELEQDVPATSGAIAVLRGIEIGADIYAVMYEW